jgi:hypothetical protein
MAAVYDRRTNAMAIFGSSRKRVVKWLVAGVAIIFIFVFYWIAFAGPGSHDVGPLVSTKAELLALTMAARTYISDNGSFPKNLDNHIFWSDLSGADSGKVYMEFETSQQNDKGEITDPWGRPYRIWYFSDKEVGITSAGPDKTFGTADDISNQ